MKILAYVEMKTERAQVHLDALNRELRPLFDEPHTVVTREDAEKSRYIRRTYCKTVPNVAAMLLGEFLYSLRSGLDQLAWQLALPVAKRDTPRKIFFPIFQRVVNNKERRDLADTLKLFPSDIAAEIDALQPYKGPGAAEEHALWQLHTLCNLDKHCVVPFCNTATKISYPLNGVVAMLHTENAIEVSVPLEQKPELDSHPNATFQIELGEWNADLRIPLRRLADIHDFVRSTVIPRFARFDADIPESPAYRTDGPEAVYR